MSPCNDAAVEGVDRRRSSVKYLHVRQAWRDTCAAAEITALHFHDLRRELASTLRESGAPDHIVADVLGQANHPKPVSGRIVRGQEQG